MTYSCLRNIALENKSDKTDFLKVLIEKNLESFRVREDGQIYTSIRLTVVAACRMYLNHFPMDVQVCNLKVSQILLSIYSQALFLFRLNHSGTIRGMLFLPGHPNHLISPPISRFFFLFNFDSFNIQFDQTSSDASIHPCWPSNSWLYKELYVWHIHVYRGTFHSKGTHSSN